MDVEDEIARGSPFLFAKCVSSSFILLFFSSSSSSLNNLSVPHPKWIIGSLRSLLVGHSLFYNSIMVHIINGRSVARSGLRAMIRRNRYLSRSLKCRYICFLHRASEHSTHFHFHKLYLHRLILYDIPFNNRLGESLENPRNDIDATIN